MSKEKMSNDSVIDRVSLRYFFARRFCGKPCPFVILPTVLKYTTNGKLDMQWLFLINSLLKQI